MMRTYVKGIIPSNVEITDKLYTNDIDRISPGVDGFVTDSEVRELIQDYRETQKDDLRTNLIYTFSRYVVSIAKNYQSQGLTLSDLISEGMIGLITAIDNFDLKQDTQFMTYANVVISRQMREALDQFNLPVKVPKNIRNQHRKIRTKTEDMLLRGHSPDEIEDEFLDNDSALTMYHNPGLYSKVNVGVNSSDEEYELDPDVVFISTEKPHPRLDRQDLQKDINRIFKTRLSPIEARILRLYFGIDQPYRIVSTADLGKKLGMSGERARQLKESGLQKLRSKDCREILVKYL